MDYVLLIKEPNEYLQQRRYLVALDDIWEITFQVDLEHPLLDNNKGCRIIITTKNKYVSDFCKKSTYVYVDQMKLVPQEKAW